MPLLPVWPLNFSLKLNDSVVELAAIKSVIAPLLPKEDTSL